MKSLTALRSLLTGLLALTCVTAFAEGPTPPPWRSLTDINLWREDSSGNLPSRWIQSGNIIARDAVLTSHLGPIDLMTKEEFGDFDLEFQWQYGSAGEPSGVIYRASDEYARPGFSGPEYEFALVPTPPRNILMDASGGVHALYPGKQGLQGPAGTYQWNTSRIVARGSRIEHWYNGVEVVAYDTESADWKARVKGSPFAKYPNFGRAEKGRIVLDGMMPPNTAISLRDIKIRVYDQPAPAHYAFVDPDPPPVQTGAGAVKYFEAVCITDPLGSERISYITPAFEVTPPRATPEIEKAWLENASKKLQLSEQQHLSGSCWASTGSQTRVRLMIENQIRQDAMNGITDKPLSWSYKPEQPPPVANNVGPHVQRRGLKDAPPVTTAPAQPQVVGPHGEGATVTKQKDGSYLLSYTAIEPGQADKHLQYKVAPMTVQIPAGIPQAQPPPNAWIWMGEGADADKALMFKVEANGILRWTPINPMAAKMYLAH